MAARARGLPHALRAERRGRARARRGDREGLGRRKRAAVAAEQLRMDAPAPRLALHTRRRADRAERGGGALRRPAQVAPPLAVVDPDAQDGARTRVAPAGAAVMDAAIRTSVVLPVGERSPLLDGCLEAIQS